MNGYNLNYFDLSLVFHDSFYSAVRFILLGQNIYVVCITNTKHGSS